MTTDEGSAWSPQPASQETSPPWDSGGGPPQVRPPPGAGAQAEIQPWQLQRSLFPSIQVPVVLAGHAAPCPVFR